jgi:hypothetical protein
VFVVVVLVVQSTILIVFVVVVMVVNMSCDFTKVVFVVHNIFVIDWCFNKTDI